ncbi:MAG: Sec-independent protein translocase subunit TatA [Mycobacteriaceae bacterium]|nr:Sec-independent protein translocase subunit TatA [Mycobacteriaceae bacterium]
MWANGIQFWHILVLLAVLVLVFGSKKLPDAARSLGRSMRIFKSEIRELQHDGKSEETPKPNPVQSERVDPSATEASGATDPNHTDARPA